jgi:uncharacterized repeat protein (TIGR04138 family)
MENRGMGQDLCVVCGHDHIGPTGQRFAEIIPGEFVAPYTGPLIPEDTKFPGDAYEFVYQGNDKFWREWLYDPETDTFRIDIDTDTFDAASLPGMTARELLDILRQLALEKFRRNAKSQLNAWNIHSCEDFGTIFFNMVEAGFNLKQPGMNKEDFQHGYNFAEAFPQDG